jgi:two-component system NtrC family sensor kinase
MNKLFGIAHQSYKTELIQNQSQLITILLGSLLVIATAYIVFLIYSSIHKRDRAERILRASEERYRTLFERVPVGLYRTKPDGQIIDVNPALAEMLGYPDRTSLLVMNARDLFTNPQDRQEEMNLLDQKHQPFSTELQLRRFDGSSIWVRDTVRPVYTPDGQVIFYDGSLEDITERRRADEAHLLLASIVKSSDDAIIAETMDGAIVSWNSGAEKIFGYQAQEVIGHSLTILQPDDRKEESGRILVRIKNGERVDHYETVRIRKDGKQIDVSLSISPIIDATGEVIGVSMIARDVSEHKRLEQSILRMERLSAMGKVTASLAHEVKNPLQAIQSNLDLLLDFPMEESERQECLELCRREAESLIEITQRMLVFSRPDQSTYRELSIAQIWADTLALVGHTLQNARVAVNTDIPAELPEVRGAPHQLRQVFLNLVLNSVEAIESEGTISLVARQNGDQLVINVANDGPPIPAEHLERIFEPFFTSKPGGAGLGLFISHNILQGHGGTLQVENLEAGNGVVFTLTLPVALMPANQVSSPERESSL